MFVICFHPAVTLASGFLIFGQYEGGSIMTNSISRFSVKKIFTAVLITLLFVLLFNGNKLNAKAADGVSVSYRTHVENVGWQDYTSDGATSGTYGRALRLEGINIRVSGVPNLGVEYRVHVQNDGWQDYVANDAMAGTEGRALRLEDINIRLTGANAANYDIYYKVHVENIGWQDWRKNGEMAGTEGRALRLEGIEIQVVAKGSGIPTSYSTMMDEVTALTNNYRAQNGLAPVTLDSTLTNVATIRSEEGARQGYISHRRSDGSNVTAIANNWGVNWRIMGENLGRYQTTPSQLVNMWINSASHRANLVNPSFSRVGVGIARTADGNYYFTQIFAD